LLAESTSDLSLVRHP